jgi:hypothetical protein
MEKCKWVKYTLISAGMKFRNKKKFRYGILNRSINNYSEAHSGSFPKGTRSEDDRSEKLSLMYGALYSRPILLHNAVLLTETKVDTGCKRRPRTVLN